MHQQEQTVLNHQLSEAIQSGDCYAVRTLAARGAALFNNPVDELTPLIQAIYLKNMEMVFTLVDLMVEHSYYNQDGACRYTALVNLFNSECLKQKYQHDKNLKIKLREYLASALVREGGAVIRVDLGVLIRPEIIDLNFVLRNVDMLQGKGGLFRAGQKKAVKQILGQVRQLKSVLFRSSGNSIDDDITLIRAAEAGHLATVVDILKQNPDRINKSFNKNFRQYYGCTVLYIAAHSRHLSVVDFLLSKGADPNFGDGSLLLESITDRHCEVVKALVNGGADLFVEKEKCNTPLGRADSLGEEEIVTILLDAMIQKAHSDQLQPGSTIYSWIIAQLNELEFKRTDLVRSSFKPVVRACLVAALSKKAERLNTEGNIPALNAELSGLEEMRSSLNLLQGKGGFAKTAEKKGAMIAIEALIESIQKAMHSASPAQKRLAAEAKLLAAAESGRLEKVKQLVESGVNVNCVDQYFLTPLLYAAYGNHQAVFDFLTEQGAGLDPRSNNKQRFYSAVKNGSALVMRALLRAGVAFNPAEDRGDYSLFHEAVQSDRTDVVKELLYAVATGDDPQAFFWRNRLLSYAVSKGCAEVVRFLVDAGVDVNADKERRNGLSFLRFACMSFDSSKAENYRAILEALVQAGADINEAKNGKTLLYFAAKCGAYPIILFLIDNGVSLREQRHPSPLGIAIKHYSSSENPPRYKYKEAVKCLLSGMIQQAGLPVEYSNTIYSFMIEVLNDEELTDVLTDYPELPVLIRDTLYSTLAAKVDRLIQENDRDNLEAELAGLKEMVSEVALLQGEGGRFKFFDKNSPTIKIKALIEKLKQTLDPASVPVEVVKSPERTVKLGRRRNFLPSDSGVDNLNAMYTKKGEPEDKLTPKDRTSAVSFLGGL